jgi:hypothetical protein
LYYYNRQPKFDLKRLHDFTARRAAYEISGPTAGEVSPSAARQWKVLVGAAADGELAKPYRFTVSKPAEDWTSAEADDSGWASGQAPFGHDLAGVRTSWTNDNIWLRQNFDSEAGAIQAAELVIFHDEDTEVYVNGQPIWNRGGFTTAYEAFDVTKALQRALRKGRNILAVHTHQTTGGQFIDLALLCEARTMKTAGLDGH